MTVYNCGLDGILLERKDPKTTNYIQSFMQLSGLIKHSITMYLTSSDWAAVIAELDAQYADQLMDPTKPKPWGNNRPLQFGAKDPVLKVVNSGTEDQRVCNALNAEAADIARYGETKSKVLH